MSRRSRNPRRVAFVWERKRDVASGWVRRHARSFVGVGVGVAVLAMMFLVEARHRKIHATRAAIDSVMRAVEAFRADQGRCPQSVAELVRPPDNPNGRARYLAELRLDGWGRPFALTCPGRKHPNSADVVSGGPEYAFGLDRIE